MPMYLKNLRISKNIFQVKIQLWLFLIGLFLLLKLILIFHPYLFIQTLFKFYLLASFMLSKASLSRIQLLLIYLVHHHSCPSNEQFEMIYLFQMFKRNHRWFNFPKCMHYNFESDLIEEKASFNN